MQWWPPTSIWRGWLMCAELSGADAPAHRSEGAHCAQILFCLPAAEKGQGGFQNVALALRPHMSLPAKAGNPVLRGFNGNRPWIPRVRGMTM